MMNRSIGSGGRSASSAPDEAMSREQWLLPWPVMLIAAPDKQDGK
jgi:hypothetical protein